VRKSAEAEFGDTLKFVVFGHIGDGNLHILMGAQPFTGETKHRIEELVYSPLQALGGSVSAEHGIGLDKRDWLQLSRSPEELALMRTLKTALDPKGILNPGKVLS
jgi:FAD/FMN-containing dehydrogenase